MLKLLLSRNKFLSPALAAGLLCAGTALAQQGPIHINADSAEFTETTGESVYIGNVELRRGNMTMKGNRLKVTRNPKTQALTAILVGQPATITQPDRRTGETITARASQIDYDSVRDMLVMQGNAQIIRGAERMVGQRIRYYVQTQKIVTDGGRVDIVIDPSQHQNSGR